MALNGEEKENKFKLRKAEGWGKGLRKKRC